MTEKEAIRNQIDALNKDILALLNRRQTLAPLTPLLESCDSGKQRRAEEEG